MPISAVSITELGLGIIQRDAEAAFPRECCGLLIGTSTDVVQVTEVVAADNHALEPNRFLIDPQVQFDWMRKLRGTDQRLVGHYHSHPTGCAAPSDYDGAMAHEAGQVWLIVPVANGVAGEVRAHISQSDGLKFREIPLKVIR